MSLTDRIPYVEQGDAAYINQFDYADRVVVVTLLGISLMGVVMVLTEHATEAELANLSEPILFGGSVLDITGWFLIFFFVWPLIRLVLVWLRRAAQDAGGRAYRQLREARQ